MPEVPRFYKQQRLTTSAGNVPLDMGDIRQATSGWRELGNLGNAMTQIGMAFQEKKQQAEYHDQLNTAKTTVLKKFLEHKNSLDKSDTTNWQKNLESFQSQLPNDIKFTNKEAQDEFNLWLEREKLGQLQDITGTQSRVDTRNFVQSFNINANLTKEMAITADTPQGYQMSLTDGMALYGLKPNEKTGKPELIEDWENPLFDSDEVRLKGFEAWQKDVDEKRQLLLSQQANENLREQWQAIIDDAVTSEGDVARAKKDAQSLILDAKKDGIITAKDTGTQNSNLNGYTTGKIRQAEKKKEETDSTITADFIKKINSFDLDPDQILAAPMSREMEDLWINGKEIIDKDGKKITLPAIADVMYDPAPTATTPDGFGIAANAVFEFAAKKKSTISAYEDLLKARYIDKTLTDDDFNWAVNRIQNPYPRHVSDMIQNELAGAEADIARKEDWWWRTKREDARIKAKTVQVAKQLIDWVEDELAYNPKKIFTPKEIFAMKAELGVSVKEPVNLAPDKEGKEVDYKMVKSPAMELDPYWEKLDNESKKELWQIYQDQEKLDIALERIKDKYGNVR